MTNREKVIKGLECCLEGLCDCCPYESIGSPGGCKDEPLVDALNALKAQEPIVPIIGKIHNEDGSTNYYLHCPFDGTVIDVGDRFCRKCGRPVKWYG